MKVFTVLFSLLLSNMLLFSQSYWEKFELPLMGAMNEIEVLNDTSIIYINYVNDIYPWSSPIMSFKMLGKNFKSRVIEEFDRTGHNNESNYIYKYVSDCYGACFFYVPYDLVKIYSNVNDSEKEIDSISNFKHNDLIGFDGRIYRYDAPKLYILDSNRKWQVFIDSLVGINKINSFGFIGNEYFFITADSLIHYDKISRHSHFERICYFSHDGTIYKTINNGDTSLVFVTESYDYNKYYFFVYSQTEKSWTCDSSTFKKYDNVFFKIRMYKNEFYILFSNSIGSEHPYKLLRFIVGKAPVELFSLPGCQNNFTIANDMVYITSNGFISIYDFKGNLIRTIIEGQSINHCSSFKVFDNDNVYYSNYRNIYHYNLLKKEIKGIYSTCTTAVVKEFINCKGTYYLLPGFLVSDDSSKTWKVSDVCLGESFIHKPGIIMIDKVFKVGNDDLYKINSSKAVLSKSTDKGINWKTISHDFGIKANTDCLYKEREMFFHKDFGILLQFPTGFFRSTDYGVSWEKVSEPLGATDESIVNTELLYTNKIIFSVITFSKKDQQSLKTNIFRSNDYGKNWVKVMAGLENTNILYYGLDKFGNLYSADNSKIYILKTNSGTWVPISHNFEEGAIEGFDVYEDGTLFVFSSLNSIYRSTMLLDAEDELPVGSSELTITPNPATSELKVNFYNLEECNVSISVYNLLGKKVAEPYRDYSTQGSKSVSWDCSGLPAGKYMVKLQAGADVRFSGFMIQR